MPPGRLGKNILGQPIFIRFDQEKSGLNEAPKAQWSLLEENYLILFWKVGFQHKMFKNNFISWKNKIQT